MTNEVMLDGVRKRLAMPNRRQVRVDEPVGVAETCALCRGLFRAPEPTETRFAVCPGCKSEAVLLSGSGDPRATA